MRCLIILLALFPMSLRAETTLNWYPDQRNFPLGECVRSHSPSNGEKYVEKVKPEECRPDKTTFWWSGTQCFEVDSATQGKTYGVREKDVKKCAPEGAQYAFLDDKKECWLVDSSGVSKFRARVETSECKPDEENVTFKFFPDPSGIGGECLEVHKQLGADRWKKKAQLARCKPQSTTFAWRPTGEFKGVCFEIAADGAQYYSAKVRAEDCRPEKVIYKFDRKTEKSGVCFEVDSETNGQRYVQKVSIQKCRPD